MPTQKFRFNWLNRWINLNFINKKKFSVKNKLKSQVFSSLININKAINSKAEKAYSSSKKRENSVLIRSRVQSSILYNRSRKNINEFKEDFLNNIDGKTISAKIATPNDKNNKNETLHSDNRLTTLIKVNRSGTLSLNELQNFEKKSNKKFNCFLSTSLKNSNTNIKHNSTLSENNSSQTIHQKDKFLKKCSISVDITKAKSNTEVLKMCLSELGWQDYPNDLTNGYDIIWHSSASSNESDNGSGISCATYSRINKFPCNFFFNLFFLIFLQSQNVTL